MPGRNKMKVERNDNLIIKNIHEIVDHAVALVDLGAAHLLPLSVVKCVYEAKEAAIRASDAMGTLRMMCEDPG